MTNPISIFVTGAIVATVPLAFTLMLHSPFQSEAQNIEDTVNEMKIYAEKVGLPYSQSKSVRPSDELNDLLVKAGETADNVTMEYSVKVTGQGKDTVKTYTVDLMANKTLAWNVRGSPEVIYSNECTVSKEGISSRIVYRDFGETVDEVKTSSVTELKEVRSAISDYHCTQMIEKGVFGKIDDLAEI